MNRVTCFIREMIRNAVPTRLCDLESGLECKYPDYVIATMYIWWNLLSQTIRNES